MKYTVDKMRARLGFVVSDREPRILTWESGGCHPASLAECALWDALAEHVTADEQAVPITHDKNDQFDELVAQVMFEFDKIDKIFAAHLSNRREPVVAWMTPGGDVSRSWLWATERCQPGQKPTPLYLAPPAKPSTISAEVDLHDRIEFALRDAGFGLDEASALAQKATAARVPEEDVRWLLSQMRHHEFSHDYIKDEKRCEKCKRIKRITAMLTTTRQTDR